jgi:DNA processing protein
MQENELISWLKIVNVKGVGPVKLLRLLDKLGSFSNIIDATKEELWTSNQFNEDQIGEWFKLKNASDDVFTRAIKASEQSNTHIIPLIDPTYPKRLREIPSPPYTLFAKGDLSLLSHKKNIAMVGSRESEELTCQWTHNLAKDLANEGFVIVSGGAIGVDSAAHKGALDSKNKKTICVFGTGMDNPYPPENQELFRNIIEEGGLLISEHLPNFTGSRIALVNRNRITSGLCESIMLCSSKKQGGSMVQIKTAYEQRRKIFIPPLTLQLRPSDGFEQAIIEFGAIETANANDIIMKLASQEKDASIQKKLIA